MRIAMVGATMAVAAVGAVGIAALAKPAAKVAPAKPAAPPAPAVPPATFPDRATVLDQLAALGARRLAELTASVLGGTPSSDGVPEEPWSEPYGENVRKPIRPRTLGAIAALGPAAACVRPTSEERAAVGKALTAADPAMRTAISIELRFGCKERGGMVVDIDYVPAATGAMAPSHEIEVWKVVRVSEATAAARVTVLGHYRGEAKETWMEWSNEVTLTTMLLADLDGDGVRDAILARHKHVGGSMRSDASLSIWMSSTRRVAELGILGDWVTLAAQAWAPGTPLVLSTEVPDYEYKPQPLYRCLQPAGRLDLCPAIDAARRTDRAFALAHRFVNRQVCEPEESCELDRELLARLLDELGAAPADRARLLAEVPPARPAAQVKRAIAAGLEAAAEPSLLRQHGEVVEPQPADPRRPALMKLLGDEVCAEVPAPQQKQMAARLDQWIASNSARLMLERGDCQAGKRCPWKRPQPFRIWSACADGTRGHWTGRWTHLDDKDQLLAVDALFHVDDEVKLLTSGSIIGDAAECAACAGPPDAQLDVQLYRRGAAMMALFVLRPYGDSPHQLSASVDGALTALAALYGERWYRFSSPYNAAVAVESVIEIPSADFKETAFWHWDGGWKKLAEFPAPKMNSVEPKLGAAGAWIWRQQRRVEAQAVLTKLDAEEWARSARYREEIQQAMVFAGVDAAVQARVAALAKSL